MRLVVVCLVVSLTACVPKQVKDVQAATDGRVAMLTTRQASMEQNLADAEQKVDQAQAALRMIGKDKGDLLQALDEASDSVRSMRGELETLRFELDELKTSFAAYVEQQEARQLYDEARLAQVEKSLGLRPPPRPEAGAITLPSGPEGTPAPEATDVPPTARGKLEKAVEEMEAGRYGVARFYLLKAVAEHPGDPLLAEIRYRIGETWALEGVWNKSALAFNEVVDNHKKSRWAPWAMLRQGEAFEQLGQKDGAALFYEDLVHMYPKSDAAPEARKKLDALK